MTLDIIVVYVSAVTCPPAGHAPRTTAAFLTLHCRVMYDSMKCDIFMLNYFFFLLFLFFSVTKNEEQKDQKDQKATSESESRRTSLKQQKCKVWRQFEIAIAIEQTIKTFKYCDSVFTVNCTGQRAAAASSSPVCHSGILAFWHFGKPSAHSFIPSFITSNSFQKLVPLPGKVHSLPFWPAKIGAKNGGKRTALLSFYLQLLQRPTDKLTTICH